jgi:SAM-dependent methyltransferase
MSPALLSLERALQPVLLGAARGMLLDVGCGDMPYRALVRSQVDSYDGLDIEERAVPVRYRCSVTDMSIVPSESYDTVLCSEVLEHVSRPRLALEQMARVMRPGASLVVSVPFLGRLHEEPEDYYRYTRHGLKQLVAGAGFEAIEVVEHGSIASFLGHQVSSAVIVGTWHIPIVRWIGFALNLVLVVLPAAVLDAAARPLRRKLPLGYVLVARKPESGGGVS